MRIIKIKHLIQKQKYLFTLEEEGKIIEKEKLNCFSFLWFKIVLYSIYGQLDFYFESWDTFFMNGKEKNIFCITTKTYERNNNTESNSQLPTTERKYVRVIFFS